MDEPLEITQEQLELDQKLLQACETFDRQAVVALEAKKPDFWFQDLQTGKGPLHLVVEAGVGRDESEVVDFLSYLLENAAVWNQMSKDWETPGCTARRLHGASSPIYQCLISAGVRAELLLSALNAPDTSKNDAFMAAKLAYTEPTDSAKTLLDSDNNAIMMTWETEIMQRSADMVAAPGKSVLNIGFGLGIIDTAIQAHNPSRHVIIEAHPDVLAKMRADGWFDRPNVEIIPHRWQDVVDSLADRETFDGIYYDPFEQFSDMYLFFDAVVALLNPTGTFSFFHGCGADNQTVYDVYTAILEIELPTFGLSCDFEELEVRMSDEEWKGAKRRYWNLPYYRLPKCRFL